MYYNVKRYFLTTLTGCIFTVLLVYSNVVRFNHISKVRNLTTLCYSNKVISDQVEIAPTLHIFSFMMENVEYNLTDRIIMK